MSNSVKPYRIKRPSTANKRENTKENLKQATDLALLQENTAVSQTLVQQHIQQDGVSAELNPSPPTFGSCSNINQTSRRARLKSTNRLGTGTHTAANTEKTESEITVVFEHEEDVTKALMERSKQINDWLMAGSLSMKMLREAVRDCIFAGRLASQSQYEYLSKVQQLVCKKIQLLMLMRTSEKNYGDRQVRIGSMIEERLKRLQGMMVSSLAAK